MTVIVSEQYDRVIGVDTHAATHSWAVVAAGTGAVLSEAVFDTTAAGLAQAHGWLVEQVGARSVLVVVEGTGSYGAIVTDRLQRAGFTVVEAAPMTSRRRGAGKSDALDAVRIARAVLGHTRGELRVPRSMGADAPRVAIRVLVVAREQMTGERTRAVNALTALVRTVDLGVDARTALTAGQ